MTSLLPYNTFKIVANAKILCIIQNIEQLTNCLSKYKEARKMVLGGGSNVIFLNDFDGLILKNEIKGKEIISENENEIFVKFGAGENWHETVLYCIKNNWGGIENLSLIPGTVGAAPIQNIGAYGVELKDVFHECEVFFFDDFTIKNFHLSDCNFEYRESIFKHNLKNKICITSVTLRLSKNKHKYKISYGDIKQKLDDKNIFDPNLKDISDVIIQIRESKIPNPNIIGNCGSFFKNPEIDINQFNLLKLNYPTIPSFKINENRVKIPAAWLIEQCNLKGFQIGGAAVHTLQALILINKKNATGNDVLQLSSQIINSVQNKFDIKLEREVNIIE